MKRLLSSILVLCMMCVCFTGCSTEEIGYMSMTQDILELDSYELKSDITIELSKEGFVTLDDIPYEISEAIDNFGPISIGIDGKVNMSKSYLGLDISVKESGFGIDEKISLYCTEGGVFIPKENLVDLYVLYLKQTTVYSNEMLGEIQSEVLKGLPNIEYICLADVNIFENKEDIFKLLEEELDMSDGDKATFDFIKYIADLEFLSDYTTGLVKKIDGGYELTITVEDIVRVFESIVKYIAENEEKIYNALLTEEQKIELENYIKGTHTEIPKEDIVDNCIDEVENCLPVYEPTYAITIYDMMELIKELAEVFDTPDMAEVDYVVELLKGTKITNSLVKENGAYKDKDLLEVYYEGVKYISVAAESEIVVKEVEPKIISGVLVEDCVDEIERITYKVNPIDTAYGEWYKGVSEGDMYLEAGRKEGTETINISYILVEDRIYLPLRKICESFGEEVTWDESERKAYIVRNGEKIDMTGLIDNDRTFIKIRDFEKLGYEIGYEEGDDNHRFSIINLAVQK